MLLFCLKIGSPNYEYEALPAIQFNSNLGLNSLPSTALLYQSVSGWTGKVGLDEYLQVDLGAVGVVNMIATQGKYKGLLPILVTSYNIDYSMDKITFTRYSKLFTVPFDSKNDEVIFNFFEPTAIKAQLIRIIPSTYRTYKSLRIELYGKKTLNECNYSTLNNCDKINSVCVDTVAGYSCTCNQGTIDNYKNGFSCSLINECLEKDIYKHKCDLNAICSDTRYSYTCFCNMGKKFLSKKTCLSIIFILFGNKTICWLQDF